MPELETATQLADPLLRRPPALAVLLQGLPLAIGLSSHAVINLVDLAMVGRLGGDAINAAHVGSTWNFLPMIVGNCVSTALLSQLSQRLGQADVDGARRLNWRGQWFMLWLSLAIAVSTALPATAMVDRTGLTGSTRDDAIHYLVVSNLGCVPMFVLMQATAAMRAAGEALVPLLLLLLANVINLAVGAALLFGWDAVALPSVGVVGAAYAAVIGRFVACVLAVVWLLRRRHLLTLRFYPTAKPPPAVVWPLLRDAWPQTLQIGLRAGVVLWLTECVVRNFGDEATASLGITTRLDSLVLFSSLGFANAATAYAGRAVVVGWPNRARAAGYWAALQAGALGALFVLAMGAAATVLVEWFLPSASAEVVAVTHLYFGSAAWSQVLGAMALAAMGAVQGAGCMKAPLVVDLVGFGLVMTLVGVAAKDGGSLASIYQALVLGMAGVAALHLLLVVKGRWPHAVGDALRRLP